MPTLLTVTEMPQIPGLTSPGRFYTILTDPAPLAGMASPDAHTPWSGLYAAGFRYVVCLADNDPSYDPTPLKHLYCCKLEDLNHGGDPSRPEVDRNLIQQATVASLEKIRSGEGVIVHCVGGTGRTGTVLGCLLRELGYSPDQAVGYLDLLMCSRERRGWPEAEWQATIVRGYSTKKPG